MSRIPPRVAGAVAVLLAVGLLALGYEQTALSVVVGLVVALAGHWALSR